MSDLSLMVKAGVQWGLFGGAIENLGTERHHDEYIRPLIDLDLLGCFAMTETGHGSDVQALETTATYDPATERVRHPLPHSVVAQGLHRRRRAARHGRGGVRAVDHRRRVARRALLRRSDPRRRRQRPARSDDLGLRSQGRTARRRQRPDRVRLRCGSRARTCSTSTSDVDAGRHVRRPHRQPEPPVLHDGRHAGARPHHRRWVRGRRSAGRADHRDAVRGEAPAVRARRAATAEVPIMDYLVHQRRLLPLIARAYALGFAQNELVSTHEPSPDHVAGGPRSAGAARTRGSCRRPEGRQHLARVAGDPGVPRSVRRRGLLAENRLTALRADIDVFTTFEGDNHVLTQLVAKELLTVLRRRGAGHEPGRLDALRRDDDLRCREEADRCAADHPDLPRHPAGQRGGRQPLQPRYAADDVRGPRAVSALHCGATSPGSHEPRGERVRRVQLRSGPCAARRRGAYRPRGAGGVRRRRSTTARTKRRAACSRSCATSTRSP